MIALMATLLEMDWLRRRDLDHMAAQFVSLRRLRGRDPMQLIASGNPVHCWSPERRGIPVPVLDRRITPCHGHMAGVAQG